MNARKPGPFAKVEDIKNTQQSLWEKIVFGVRAIYSAARLEKSVRNHFWGALAMLVTLILLRPKIIWWGVCLFGSAICLAFEIFNTAVEEIADYISPEFDSRIGRIKDLAAGAAVMAGAGMFICGVLMILDTLWLG